MVDERYKETRELIHKQMELLAKRSEICAISAEEMVKMSAEMRNIHNDLYVQRGIPLWTNCSGEETTGVQKKDDWIEERNKKIIHWLWTIFVSVVTALITTLVYIA